MEAFADNADATTRTAAVSEADAAYRAVHSTALAEVPNGQSLSHVALLEAMTPSLAQSYRAAHVVTQFGLGSAHAGAWYAAFFSTSLFGADGWRNEESNLVALLRHIVGNPFRPVTADPSWLTSIVVALAQAIYDERAFGRMPVLGDALEEAGCGDRDILDHCRQPGEHVRGCWVVDLILGKQ
jgi:hypothetical protein